MNQTPINVGQNYLAGMTGGFQAGQQIKQANDQNTLRNIFATQDVNDPAVQQQIMGLDPKTGLALQNQTYQREQDAIQRGRQVKADNRADEAFRMQVEQHAAKMSAAERQENAAKIEQGVMQAIPLVESGNLNGLNQLFTQYGIEPVKTMEEGVAVLGQYKTVLDALTDVRELNAGPKAQSPQGKFYADQGAGLVPEGEQFKGEGTTINNNTGGGSKLYETLDKAQGDMFGTLIENATNASGKIAMIDQMEAYLGAADTPEGMAAALKTFAGEWGIKTEGLGTLQATQAIINKLVPAQRTPGSGPMSDADLALFKQSLPRLINTREGNLAIIRTLRGMAQYEASQGQIAAAVANREMTPADARRALSELENPLQVFRGSGETKIGGRIDPETQSLIDRYAK